MCILLDSCVILCSQEWQSHHESQPHLSILCHRSKCLSGHGHVFWSFTVRAQTSCACGTGLGAANPKGGAGAAANPKGAGAGAAGAAAGAGACRCCCRCRCCRCWCCRCCCRCWCWCCRCWCFFSFSRLCYRHQSLLPEQQDWKTCFFWWNTLCMCIWECAQPRRQGWWARTWRTPAQQKESTDSASHLMMP